MVTILFWASVAGVLYTYFGYALLLTVCRLFCRGPASKADDGYLPTVSICLAAYNEAAHLRRKMENCLALDYPREKVQIMVGSDGSDDGTNEIAAEFAEAGVVLHAFQPRRGKMAAVNRLVAAADGEICVFSDISELFEPDAVRKLVRHFADPGIGAVTGNHIYHATKTGLGAGTSFYWKFQRFLQSVESRLWSVCACDGTIYACRRELFPFPPDETINDDNAVPAGILLQGKRVIFEPQAIARGDVLTRASRFFRQKIRGQAGRYQNFVNFPRMFVPWPLRRWWIFVSHLVLPVLVPWLLVLALVSNLWLATVGGDLYRWLLAGQFVVYGLALLGYAAERFRLYIPLVAIPFYFVTANLGSLIGCIAFFSGRQRAAWRKVE
jgi:poly-beta-1,6-N-acetyl-D-glucosamine synthase